MMTGRPEDRERSCCEGEEEEAPSVVGGRAWGEDELHVAGGGRGASSTSPPPLPWSLNGDTGSKCCCCSFTALELAKTGLGGKSMLFLPPPRPTRFRLAVERRGGGEEGPSSPSFPPSALPGEGEGGGVGDPARALAAAAAATAQGLAPPPPPPLPPPPMLSDRAPAALFLPDLFPPPPSPVSLLEAPPHPPGSVHPYRCMPNAHSTGEFSRDERRARSAAAETRRLRCEGGGGRGC